MEWRKVVTEYIDKLHPVKIDEMSVARALSLLDLTRLKEDDTESDVAFFIEKAKTPFGSVASVCLLPPFVRMAHTEFFASKVKVGTVANFPQGETPLETVLIEISDALTDGANEIDIVFPYHRYLAGERQYAENFIRACRAACGNEVTLKIILETGVLGDPAIIADAAFDALKAGADFVKTSTGKVTPGATLEAAAVLLLVVKHMMPNLQRKIGVKVSGGIKDLQESLQYISLADDILGIQHVNAETFRVGSSQLINEIINFKG